MIFSAGHGRRGQARRGVAGRGMARPGVVRRGEARQAWRGLAWRELRAAVGPRGADVVVENVGGDVWDGCTRCIGWGGRLVVVGFSSGTIPQEKLNRVLLKHVSIVGVHFGPVREHEPHVVRAAFHALGELYRIGKIRPSVSRVLPLEDVATALTLIGGRGSVEAQQYVCCLDLGTLARRQFDLQGGGVVRQYDAVDRPAIDKHLVHLHLAANRRLEPVEPINY